VACAVAFCDDEVLLLRRSMNETFLPGRWTLPAGKLQDGEDPEVAALRELREETGLTGKLLGPTGTSSFASVYKGTPTDWTQFNYLVRVQDRQCVVLDAAHCAHRWVPVASRVVLSDLVDPYTMGVIDQAFPHAA
jgi:8-oxo-dGTP diphosphatase